MTAQLPNTDVSINVSLFRPCGEIVYVDGWLYLRTHRALGVYARSLNNRSTYYRGVGLRTWVRETVITERLFDSFVSNVEAMQRGYTTAALWTDCLPSEGDGETGGRKGLEPTPELVARDQDLCARFLSADTADCEVYAETVTSGDGDPWGTLGHDLWLSSHGHGAGFFDREGVPEDVREQLQRVASSDPFDDVGGSLYPLDNGDGTAGVA